MRQGGRIASAKAKKHAAALRAAFYADMRKSCKDQYDVYYAQAFATVVLLLAILVKSAQSLGQGITWLFGEENVSSVTEKLKKARGSFDSAVSGLYNKFSETLFGNHIDTGEETMMPKDKEDIVGLLTPIVNQLEYMFKVNDGQKLLNEFSETLESTPIAGAAVGSGALVLNAAVGHKLFAALGSLMHTLLRFLKRSGRILQPLADRFRSMHGVPAHKLACK